MKPIPVCLSKDGVCLISKVYVFFPKYFNLNFADMKIRTGGNATISVHMEVTNGVRAKLRLKVLLH